MPTLLMNDRSVAGLKSKSRTAYYDEKTVGLALRVGARTKTWYFVYRNGGDPEWLKLGAYPAVGARRGARPSRSTRRHDLDVKEIDPAVERRKEPEPEPPARGVHVRRLRPVYVAFQKKRTKDWENEAQKIARHLLPAWGPLPLKSITRRHIQDLLDTVEAKGLTIGVNRIQALIRRMFTVALDRDKVDAHPAIGILKRFPENPRDRVLSDDELRQLWAGLDAQPGAASDAMRLRLLLGQRGNETAGMLWRELDLETATWTLPRPRTKTKQPHVVGLPPTALALLERRRAESDEQEEHVFPGLSLQGDEHRALHAIHDGAYEWKDLRRTVATRLADLGFDETVIGRVLNHAKHTVTGKHYNQHRYVDEIRAALTAWDVELQRILSPTSRRRGRASCRCVPASDRHASPSRPRSVRASNAPCRGRTPADERRAAARRGRQLPWRIHRPPAFRPRPGARAGDRHRAEHHRRARSATTLAGTPGQRTGYAPRSTTARRRRRQSSSRIARTGRSHSKIPAGRPAHCHGRAPWWTVYLDVLEERQRRRHPVPRASREPSSTKPAGRSSSSRERIRSRSNPRARRRDGTARPRSAHARRTGPQCRARLAGHVRAPARNVRTRKHRETPARRAADTRPQPAYLRWHGKA